MASTAEARANKERVRSDFLAFMNTRDSRLIDSLFHADFVDHGTGLDEPTYLQAMREDIARHFSDFTELEAELEDIVADGDRVALRWLMSALKKHSGTRVRWAGMAILRLEDGQIRERWSVFTPPAAI
jgi:predicted ester cyclase